MHVNNMGRELQRPLANSNVYYGPSVVGPLMPANVYGNRYPIVPVYQNNGYNKQYNNVNYMPVGAPQCKTIAMVNSNAAPPPVVYNYTVDKTLGGGSFGRVFSVTKKSTNEKYALKEGYKYDTVNGVFCIREMITSIIADKFPHLLGSRQFSWGMPADLTCYPKPVSIDNKMIKDDFYIFTPLGEFDIRGFRGGDFNTPFYVIKNLTMDMTLGLEYLHKSGIMHLDFKPDNIIIFKRANGELYAKIGDFGLATYWGNDFSSPIGVTTSIYRAPEAMLGYKNYDYKVDMWALGCTLYELIRPVNMLDSRLTDDLDILKDLISRVPCDIDRSKFYFYDSKKVESYINWGTKCNLTYDQFLCFDDGFKNEMGEQNLKIFYDFVFKLLTFYPHDRMSSTEALNHPFFARRKDRIDAIRSTHNVHKITEIIVSPKIMSNPYIKYIRDTAMVTAKQMLERKDIKWCNPKIIIHAIYVFDKTLEYELTNKSKYFNRDRDGNINIPTDTIKLYFITCLYLMSKLFLLDMVPIPFGQHFTSKYNTPESRTHAKDFERYVIHNVCKYFIYTNTIYEECIKVAGSKIDYNYITQYTINGLYHGHDAKTAAYMVMNGV